MIDQPPIDPLLMLQVGAPDTGTGTADTDQGGTRDGDGRSWDAPDGAPDGGLDGLPDADDPDGAAGAVKRPSAWHTLREWFVVVVVALVVALVIRTFVVAPFYIPSDSMFDTLHTDDRILVNKLSYRLHDVHRGDVVVFEKPPAVNFGDDTVEDLIKRVIGLPGDTLRFDNCAVFVNGVQIDEPYTDGACTEPPNATVDPEADGEVTVPADSYFMMGDNRRPQQSFDSRFWGFVDEDLIIGRAFVIIWPRAHWGWL
ncbi:MAG TPA: signal peptidase I [Ilumatobacteraceae bacterium]